MFDLGETKPPADAELRTYFQAQGLSKESLDAAVSGFSREALGHSQRALQNAAALKRLSDTLSASELRSVSVATQRQWTEMVTKHAAALEVELRALHKQITRLSHGPQQLPGTGDPGSAIEKPEQFARAADQLLTQTKNLDQSVSSVFASSQFQDAQPADIPSLISATSNAIPLQKAVEMASFAVQLNASGRTAATNWQNSRPEMHTSDRP